MRRPICGGDCRTLYICSALYIGLAATFLTRCRTDAENEACQIALNAATAAHAAAMAAFDAATGDELIYVGLLSRRPQYMYFIQVSF